MSMGRQRQRPISGNALARAKQRASVPTASEGPSGKVETARLKHNARYIERFNRGMLFMAVATGLVAAACLTAIPSTTCFALADTYVTALEFLGFLFATEISLFVGITLLEEEALDTRQTYTARSKFMFRSLYVVCVGGGFFCLTMLTPVARTGVANIRLSIDHCYLANEQQEKNLHDKIPLLRDPFGHTPR
jgi:hypothetical protein